MRQYLNEAEVAAAHVLQVVLGESSLHHLTRLILTGYLIEQKTNCLPTQRGRNKYHTENQCGVMVNFTGHNDNLYSIFTILHIVNVIIISVVVRGGGQRVRVICSRVEV